MYIEIKCLKTVRNLQPYLFSIKFNKLNKEMFQNQGHSNKIASTIDELE